MIRDYPAISLARNRVVVEPARGDCHIRRNSNDLDESWLDVTQADPRILIADEVLRNIKPGSTEVWLDMPAEAHLSTSDCGPFNMPCFVAALLHINGRNRKVIYRVGRWVPELNAWEAAWPD